MDGLRDMRNMPKLFQRGIFDSTILAKSYVVLHDGHLGTQPASQGMERSVIATHARADCVPAAWCRADSSVLGSLSRYRSYGPAAVHSNRTFPLPCCHQGCPAAARAAQGVPVLRLSIDHCQQRAVRRARYSSQGYVGTVHQEVPRGTASAAQQSSVIVSLIRCRHQQQH